MKESSFNSSLHELLGREGLHMQRIESGTASGIPDINICCNGREIWVESKVDAPLRPAQYAWGMRRAQECGGHVYIIRRCNQNSVYLWKFPNVCVLSGNGKIVLQKDFRKTVDRKDLFRALFPND